MNNRVWEKRNKLNMTLEQLSRKTGISKSEISKIENCYYNDILLSNAMLLAKALNTDIYDLFFIDKKYYNKRGD